MTCDGMECKWDDRMHNGMGGWRITERESNPARDADDFLAALKRKLS